MTQAMPSTNPPLVCWNCHERTQGTHFCPSCGKLQQIAGTEDYFALFEMPHKLWIDMNSLEQKFLQLSWKLHPDNFVKATETERELSLKRSSELNDAYRTLRDPGRPRRIPPRHRKHAQGRRAQAAGASRTARGSLRAERIAR